MRKTLLTCLQIAVTVIAFYFVFRDPHKRDAIGESLRHANLWWVLAGIGAAAFSPLAAVDLICLMISVLVFDLLLRGPV